MENNLKMKRLSLNIRNCFECPYLVDAGYGEIGKFYFSCLRAVQLNLPNSFIASPRRKDRIKKEWNDGPLVKMEIEIPDFCPLEEVDD